MNITSTTLVALLVGVALSGGCGGTVREIERLASPDQRVEAVWASLRDDSFVYHLYIVPIGKPPILGHQTFIADHVKNVTIRWRDARRLEVSYDRARIFKFYNFWHDRDVEKFRYIVEIRLVPNEPSQLALSPRLELADGARPTTP